MYCVKCTSVNATLERKREKMCVSVWVWECLWVRERERELDEKVRVGKRKDVWVFWYARERRNEVGWNREWEKGYSKRIEWV